MEPIMEPNAGIKPATLRLRVSCSTDWASPAMLLINILLSDSADSVIYILVIRGCMPLNIRLSRIHNQKPVFNTTQGRKTTSTYDKGHRVCIEMKGMLFTAHKNGISSPSHTKTKFPKCNSGRPSVQKLTFVALFWIRIDIKLTHLT